MTLFKQFKRYSIFVLSVLLPHCGTADKHIKTADGSEMILLPAGKFQMGGKEEDLTDYPQNFRPNYKMERPRHQVELSSFYMDKYEVTNVQYKRFLEAITLAPDSSLLHPDQPPGHAMHQHFMSPGVSPDQHPAVGMSWYAAFAYCRWAEKRLPTEAEWEYAARGTGAAYNKYPWGNKDPGADGIWRANYHPAGGTGREDGYKMTAPIGSFPDGVSPFGIMDMAGNAEEWVSDWLKLDYYTLSKGIKNPLGPASGAVKVIKSGSYVVNKYHLRIATRLYGRPDSKSDKLGFRCAKDINP